MTLYQFKLLNLNEQVQCAWDNGVLIGFREEAEEHMILYRVESFYVEIRYHTEQNEITGVYSFISEDPLKPYLDKIDISPLLQNL